MPSEKGAYLSSQALTEGKVAQRPEPASEDDESKRDLPSSTLIESLEWMRDPKVAARQVHDRGRWGGLLQPEPVCEFRRTFRSRFRTQHPPHPVRSRSHRFHGPRTQSKEVAVEEGSQRGHTKRHQRGVALAVRLRGLLPLQRETCRRRRRRRAPVKTSLFLSQEAEKALIYRRPEALLSLSPFSLSPLFSAKFVIKWLSWTTAFMTYENLSLSRLVAVPLTSASTGRGMHFHAF